MSGRRASCCGATDDTAAESAKPIADTTEPVAAGAIAARQAVLRDRRPSGLIQAIRRFFRLAEETNRA